MNYRNTYAEISIDRLRGNLKALRDLECSKKFFCPMIKANAYGHGDIKVAQLLEDEGVRFAGVALVEEAEHLRKQGIHKLELLVFSHIDKFSVESVIKNKLTPVLSHWDQIKALDKVLNVDSSIKVHIKFNTGMNRQGFALAEAKALAEYFKNQSQIKLTGICTHLAESEKLFATDSSAVKQLYKFDEVLKNYFSDFEVYIHALNSGGILASTLDVELQKYGARPGIALYGYPPEIENNSLKELDLKPVMSVKSEVTQINFLEVGDIVSYGAQWTAKQESKIAVVPIGYADGYHRCMSGQAKVLMKNQRVPVVGLICMDYIMLDVTELSGEFDVKIGDEVELLSAEALNANELAAWADTIGYEILTSISARVPRVYK